MDRTDPIVSALAPIAAFLNSVKVRFFIGGSVASSFHGAVRSTMDVDIVCEPFAEHIAALEQRLEGDYYFSHPAIVQAMKERKCFNLIHFETSFKVDVFVARDRPHDFAAFSRATVFGIGENDELEVPICSLEDSILSKLEWYKLGEETSERQWDDVTRLRKLAGKDLDVSYMRSASPGLGVSELLERLLAKSD